MTLRILVATMPRAGSTWIFNVTREICRLAGYRPMPEEAAFALGDRFEAGFRRAVRDSRRRSAWVLKTHRHLADLPEGFRVITAIRDPRDVLVSFARFTRADWQHALVATLNAVKVARTRAELGRRSPLLEIVYPDIRDRPEAVVGRIATFLDLPVDGETARAIAARFDRASVARRIREREQAVSAAMEAGRFPRAEELVRNFDRSFRVLDRATGFQSGHVSDYRDGDWRCCAPPAALAALHRALGPWLVEHGFADAREVARWADGRPEPAAV